jgi:hypothetical protein
MSPSSHKASSITDFSVFLNDGRRIQFDDAAGKIHEVPDNDLLQSLSSPSIKTLDHGLRAITIKSEVPKPFGLDNALPNVLFERDFYDDLLH